MSATREEILNTFLSRVHSYDESVSYKRANHGAVARVFRNGWLFGFPYFRWQLSRPKFLRRILGAREAKIWNRTMALPPEDEGTGLLSLYGTPVHKSERKLVLWLIKNLRSDEVVYDIGAHFGVYTALASALVKSGEVHAFEANDQLCQFLKRNFSSESKVFISCKALSAHSGETDFYSGGDLDTSTGSRFKVSEAHVLSKKVPAITLDDYVSLGHSMPTFIKMDIEGGEGDAILGAARVLKEASPRIVMEVWGGEGGETYSRKAVSLLRELGYEPFSIDLEGFVGLEPVSDPVGLSLRRSGGRDNFLFLKIAA